MSGAVINRPFCYQFHFSIQLKRKEKKEKKSVCVLTFLKP